MARSSLTMSLGRELRQVENTAPEDKGRAGTTGAAWHSGAWRLGYLGDLCKGDGGESGYGVASFV